MRSPGGHRMDWRRHGRRLSVSFLAVAWAVAASSWCSAQDTMPARELSHGDRLARDGKMEQAAEAWLAIATRHPDSPEASAALERLADRAYPVATFEARGTRPGADFEAAARLFRRLVDDYRQSPEAPEALFRLGLLLSDPACPGYDLDEAYARFSELVSVFPDSLLRAAGLYGLGDVLYSQGQYGAALAPLARLDAEFPRHERAAPGLWLQAEGLARMGQFRAALRTYQDLRDRFPDGVLADRARDRNTHLARLQRLEREDLYGPPALIRPGLAEEWRVRSLSDIAVDFRHRIAIADERADMVHVLDATGRPLSRSDVVRPYAVWLGDGSLMAQCEAGIWIDGRMMKLRMSDGEPFQGRAGMLARDPMGRIVLWDSRSGRLLRFDRNGDLDRSLAGDDDGRIAAAASCEGTAFALLDPREATIRLLDESGAERKVYLPRNGLRRPEHLACDFVRNFYVLDRANREIMVVGSDGSLLTRISSGRSDEDPFPRPVDLTVSSRGSILIYDERRQGVVVYP